MLRVLKLAPFGTAPDDPGDSPKFTAVLLKLATFINIIPLITALCCPGCFFTALFFLYLLTHEHNHQNHHKRQYTINRHNIDADQRLN